MTDHDTGTILKPWSAVVQPQRPTFCPMDDDFLFRIHVTNASLGDDLLHPTGRTSLKLCYGEAEGPEDKEILICSLVPEKVEHCRLDLTLPVGYRFSFQAVGAKANAIHLYGNLLLDEPEGLFDDATRSLAPDVEKRTAASANHGEHAYDHDLSDLLQAGSSSQVPTTSKAPSKLDSIALAGPSVLSIPDPTTGGKKRKRDKEALGDPADQTPKHFKGEGGYSTTSWTNIGNLKLRVLQRGDGKRQAKDGDKISFLFTIRLAPSDGKLPSSGSVEHLQILDSRMDPSEPERSILARWVMTEGWLLGITGMVEGEERQLIEPPELAWGSRGFGTRNIPPNATLITNIKLIALADA